MAGFFLKFIIDATANRQKLSPGLGLSPDSFHLCELHSVAIARLIMERRDPPKMFADFVDAAEAGTPNGRYVVPVKAWAELSLGTVTATRDSLKSEEIPAFVTNKD